MAIRWDPLLIEAIGREIAARWCGVPVRRLALHRASRTAALQLAGDEWLVFLLHPSAGHIVPAAPATSRPAFGGDPSPDVDIPFRRLRLTAVETRADERLLSLALAAGPGGGRSEEPTAGGGAATGGASEPEAVPSEPAFRVVLELHTNQWNTVLVRARPGTVEAVLWPRQAGGRVLRRGRPYVRPEGGRKWAEGVPALDAWRRTLGAISHRERRSAALREIAYLSTINVDYVLGAALASDERDSLDAAYARYAALREAEPGAYVLAGPRSPQPYPAHLDDPGHEVRTSLLDAMLVAARRSGNWGSPASEGGAASAARPSAPGADRRSREALVLRAAIGKRLRRVRRRREALLRELRGADPTELRDIGHLLLARQGEIPRGRERVELTDFDGRQREVELDPALSVVDNAARYYDRARRRARAARRLPAEIRALEEEEARLRQARAGVEESGPSEEAWALVGGRPPDTGVPGGSRADRGPDVPSARGAGGGGRKPLPYRRLWSAGGLEIRVGRSARANDELTFRHAAPHDIWLHARQARGAHVILRWDRRDENPARRDLIDAAMAAAVFSEARHSGLVAVDWTRRKYVRKPRKALPGAVVPERVETVFVEPDADRVRSLGARGSRPRS